MPKLRELLGGQPLHLGAAPHEGAAATLLALDCRMGVGGVPQSATGQAAILTGRNVAAEVGEHYGPKPNPAVAAILREHNIFAAIKARGGTAALLNAYPPQYFQAIASGRRLYSSIPMALNAAGIPLRDAEDLQAGRALSADFTGAGWAKRPDFPPAPVYTPQQAGQLLARLALHHTLTWFDYWISDYIGHRGDYEGAVQWLEQFDQVLAALLDHWPLDDGLILLTSDHGNLEDMATRGHTLNPVPALIIGSLQARRRFAQGLRDLAGLYSALLGYLYGQRAPSSATG
jgi:hypothetical protein